MPFLDFEKKTIDENHFLKNVVCTVKSNLHIYITKFVKVFGGQYTISLPAVRCHCDIYDPTLCKWERYGYIIYSTGMVVITNVILTKNMYHVYEYFNSLLLATIRFGVSVVKHIEMDGNTTLDISEDPPISKKVNVRYLMENFSFSFEVPLNDTPNYGQHGGKFDSIDINNTTTATTNDTTNDTADTADTITNILHSGITNSIDNIVTTTTTTTTPPPPSTVVSHISEYCAMDNYSDTCDDNMATAQPYKPSRTNNKINRSYKTHGSYIKNIKKRYKIPKTKTDSQLPPLKSGPRTLKSMYTHLQDIGDHIQNVKPGSLSVMCNCGETVCSFPADLVVLQFYRTTAEANMLYSYKSDASKKRRTANPSNSASDFFLQQRTSIHVFKNGKFIVTGAQTRNDVDRIISLMDFILKFFLTR